MKFDWLRKISIHAVGEPEVLRLAEDFGFRASAEYVAFLLEQNGGAVDLGHCSVCFPTHRGEVELRGFFGVDAIGAEWDLELENRGNMSSLSRGFFSIGCCMSMDRIV
ncbi:MAG: hypothetical protein O3A92_14675 [Verrucomicrobia bacterium]|nr:hypothetical protein [Verrucomicrobiota bacterium]